MRMKGWSAVPTALLVTCALVTPAKAAQQRKIEPLNQYVVRGGDTSKLGELGYDMTEGGGANGHRDRGHAETGRRRCAPRASR